MSVDAVDFFFVFVGFTTDIHLRSAGHGAAAHWFVTLNMKDSLSFLSSFSLDAFKAVSSTAGLINPFYEKMSKCKRRNFRFLMFFIGDILVNLVVSGEKSGRN